MRPLSGFVSAIACIALAGCKELQVQTDNRVRIDGPVDARVTADLPPVPQAGPVKQVPIGNCKTGPKIAIVDIDGLILNTPFAGPMSVGENPVALFREKLDAIEADPSVQALVLRVNSPGGGVAACTAMRHDLLRFKSRRQIPILACLLDCSTGGSYYIASAADRVIANPASVVGGIGVMLNLFNLRDLMAQFNVLPQPIKAGKFTDIGSSAKALGDEERKILQDMADEHHSRMLSEIMQSRPTSKAQAETTFDGRIFTGSQAQSRGLVDAIGDLDDAIQNAVQLTTGKPNERSQVILYRRINDPAHSIYAVTANVPLQGAGGLFPSLPGLERAKLPTFLSLWQPELTAERLSGK